MILELDPNRVNPMPGLMVVEIIEVLGGMSKGGVFVPGTTMDHMGKDTCAAKVIRKGDPPRERFERGSNHGFEARPCEPWPDAYRAALVGDVVVLPRDVDKAFVWEGKRYAIVREHEAIVAMSEEDYAKGGFSVVPWTPGEIGDVSLGVTK